MFNDRNDLWDAGRVALVFLPAAVVAGIALFTVIFYARAWRLERQSLRHRVRGLIPSHVVKISASYLILVFAASSEVAMHLDEPLTWRPFVYSVALMVGIWALHDVLRYELVRYRTLRDAPVGRRRDDLPGGSP